MDSDRHPARLTDKVKPASAGFLLLAGWFFLVTEVLAAGAYRPMRFDHLNADDGLSQNSVLAITQDATGFMWLATENGLNRYDGNGFRVFQRQRSEGAAFTNDFATGLAVDAANNLWIATDGGGLVQWDSTTETFTGYRHRSDDTNSLSGNHVSAVLFTDDGFLWVGTLRSGLNRLNLANGEVTRFQHDAADAASLSGNSVKAVYQDRAGRVWVGTETGLNLLDQNRGNFRRFVKSDDDPASLSDNRIRAIAEDFRGNLWVGTRNGLNRFDIYSGRFERFLNNAADPASLSHNRIRTIFEDSGRRLWIGTAGGLNLLSEDGRSFIRHTKDAANPESLADNNVMSIFEDRSGVLWVGTGAGGVSKWNPRSWSFGHFDARGSTLNALGSSNVSSFAEDENGRLWIGTFGGGLNALDRVTGTVLNFAHKPDDANSVSGNRIMALLHDSGDLWIGTMTGGLNRLNIASGDFEVFMHDPANVNSIGANGIMSLFKDNRGDIWVGTFGGGVNRFVRETGNFERFTHQPSLPDSLSSSRATSFAQGPEGKIWVGTDGGGLNLLDPVRGTARHFRHDSKDDGSLSSDTVYSLFVDAGGAVWVGTRAGLDRLGPDAVDSDLPRFRHTSQVDGLANDVIYGIQPDNATRLWLSTNYGLSRFDPNTGQVTNYHRGHGLQAEEFNFGAHYRSKDGELFFGGANGFNAFFPDRLEFNPTPPALVLLTFSKFNAPAETDAPYHLIDRLELGHKDSVIGFEVAALDFTAPEQNQYAYKLEGFDADWVNLGNLNRITYTNLDAGNYVLRVRAANSDGVWNEAGITLPLTMRAAPWATGWAYLAYVLLSFGILYYFWRDHRHKREMEIEYMQRLEIEVRERTHELADRNLDLERVNQKLEEASLTDPLTGLRNRRFLFEEVAKDVELMRRDYDFDEAVVNNDRRKKASGKRQPGQDLAFMMLDLDHFKPINDRCGHIAGDKILVQVRDALKKACRSSDFIIRWGGDEFLVVGRHSNRDEVEAMAERIRAQIAQTVFSLGDGQVARTSCSIGFACYPFIRSQPDLLSWQQILGLADSAMYEAKKSRNAWTGYLSTDKSDELDNVFKAIREAPEDMREKGLLEIRTGAAPGASACA